MSHSTSPFRRRERPPLRAHPGDPPAPRTLADLLEIVRDSQLEVPLEEQRAQGGGEPHSVLVPSGEQGDVSAQLSHLLAQLARAPDDTLEREPVPEHWAAALKPGDEVGRFVLLRELGRGGFGVVFEALDRELGRSVAFKAVKPGSRLHGRSEDWLRREAEAVARLNHPNIVTLHDFGRGPAGPYLIFELLRGETVAERLKAGPLPLPEAVRIAADVARVLAHAHAASVVHRDLKPGNVFLAKDGTVKVLDFGLAFLFGRGGPSSGGTPAYMAPEQWRSEPGDHRTDLFALGVLLFQLLTGQVPYRVTRERSEALDPGPPPPFPREVAPARLRRLVTWLLQKDPADRPASAQVVLDELLPVLARLERPRPSRRLVAAGAAALALVAGGLWATLRDPPLPEGKRLVVAVADFDNGTGEHGLDELSGLLSTSLEQSRRVRVLGRPRLRALMRQLGRGDAPRIDAAAGRAIAREAGAPILMLGAARKLGERYALELRALDALADRYLFSVEEQVPNRDLIPAALDRLSASARRKLREGADDIAASQVALAERVTGNVEAWQAYAEGVACHQRPSSGPSWFSDMGCVPHFERALALDPTFAMAHYRLAHILGVEGNPPESEAHLAAALRNLAHAPPKEAAIIRAWKAWTDGDGEQALSLLGEVLAAHPDDDQALELAGSLQAWRHQYAGALPFLERQLALDPWAERPLDDLVTALTALGRRADLEALVARLRARPPTAASVHALVRAAWWLGDRAEAEGAARAALEAGGGEAALGDLLRVLGGSGHPAEAEALVRPRLAETPDSPYLAMSLANAVAAQGRLAEALRTLDAAEALGPTVRRADYQFSRTYLVAGAGRPDLLWREAARTASLNPAWRSELSVLLALRGDPARAAELAASSRLEPMAAAEAEALLAWRRDGAPARAVAALLALEERDPWPDAALPPAYLVAEASAAMDDPRQALAALDRFERVWPRGAWRTWAGSRAVWLRAWALDRLGRRDEARAPALALAAQVRKADPGLPIVRDLQALQARLGSAAR